MTRNEVLLRCRLNLDQAGFLWLAEVLSGNRRIFDANGGWIWGDDLDNEPPGLLRGILAPAQELVDATNRSIGNAQESKSPDRRQYELAKTRTHLIELKRMTVSQPMLELVHLEDVLLLIAQLEQETVALQLKEKIDVESEGRWLEKQGMIQDAIRAYEKFVEEASVKPYIYKRLAILYRKLKSAEDEMRVLKEALKNVPQSSKKHREWFLERLEKLKRGK